MRSFIRVVSALGGLALSLAPSVRAAEPLKEIAIAIKLVSPRDIVVDWDDPNPGAVGHIVEWGTRPDDDFVTLGYFPAAIKSYRHPDLMWDTACYYRVRAYYGPASSEAAISLPKELSDADYKKRYEEPEDYHWAVPKIVPDDKPAEHVSIRDRDHPGAGAPTDFKVTLEPKTVCGFLLRWTDHAGDEDGQMIEMKKEGSSDWEVVALVEPNVNSFGYAFEPPARTGTLRVRPYYFGPPSKLRHLTTGKEPPPTSGPVKAKA